MTRVEPIHGGNVSLGLVRIGNAVRGSAGLWSPAVHALLCHLEAVISVFALEPWV
jgi:hypothetical protein